MLLLSNICSGVLPASVLSAEISSDRGQASMHVWKTSAALFLLCASAQAEPELPLASPEVRTAVVSVVELMGERFTDLKGPQPITLFDPAEPVPMYLGEEMPDWIVGWDALRWYFETPERFAFVDAMDYHPSNIRVRSLTPDLVLATWDVFAEMKFRNGPPIGEKLRANALLRETDAGWRFIYYAEAPKSTMSYMQDLYSEMASPEFKARFETSGSSRPLLEPPKVTP
jgi:hypothetical protein